MSKCLFNCLVLFGCFFTFRSFSFTESKNGSTLLKEDDTDYSERDDDILNLQIEANANDLHLGQSEYLEIDNPTCSRNDILGDYSNLLEQVFAQWITSPCF